MLFHEACGHGLEADAIVVGGSCGGLAGPFSLGSVVNELLHSSPVPVAVAPRGTRDSGVERVREVTCEIGERQGADLLLRTAVRFSKAAGTPLRLASLVTLDPTFGSLRGDGDAVRERALAHAQETLETAKEALLEGIPVTSTVVDGSTVEEAVGKTAAKVAPAVALLVEGAIVTAVIQGTPDAADVARDAALKLVAEEKGV